MRNERKVGDAENRLRVLFTLREMGMATQEQLWPPASVLSGLDYVTFCVSLSALCETGEIAEGPSTLPGMLYVTAKGEQTLRLFESRMAYTDRERARAEAASYLAEWAEKRRANAVYEPVNEAGQHLLCTVSEGDYPILSLRITTRDTVFAGAVMEHFRKCAASLLMRLLSANGPREEDSRKAASVISRDAGFIACITLRDGETEYRTELRFPTQISAEKWLTAAEADSCLSADLSALLEART